MPAGPARDLVRGALLDRKLQRQREQFIPTGAAYSYGLGILQLGPFCGHNGLIPGYDSTMLYSSRLHATIVVLANAAPYFDHPPPPNPYPVPVQDTLNLAVPLAQIAFPNLPPPGRPHSPAERAQGAAGTHARAQQHGPLRRQPAVRRIAFSVQR